MSHRFPWAALLLAALPALARAQALSVTLSQNPAPLGTPITVTALDAYNRGLYTPGGCLITSVRKGAPNGPSVGFFPCTLLPVAIPPCGSPTPRSATWTPANNLTPDLYFIEITHSVGPFMPTTTEYYCVTLEGAVPGPRLAASGPPMVGGLLALNIAAPAYPNAIYVAALSGSTNVGIALPGGQRLCLDPDLLFSLTFPVPIPGIFTNFQGVLDASGQVGNIAVAIPNLPQLVCFPFHAQAVVLSGSSLIPTNDLTLYVR
jgi:hypothetical protein